MSAENLQDRQDSAPSSSFAAAHELAPTTNGSSASPGASAVISAASPPSSPATSAKVVMQPRRKSRGVGEGLRPDFVFPPKPQQTAPSSANGSGSISVLHNKLSNLSIGESEPSPVVSIIATGQSNGTISATEPTLMFPDGETKRQSKSDANGSNRTSLAPPNNQHHLKTHYRTHSRNGSTVTVQDLKQAIAAVSTDLLNLPPVTASTSNTGTSEPITATRSAINEEGTSDVSGTSRSLGKSGLTTGSSAAALDSSATLLAKSKLDTVVCSAEEERVPKAIKELSVHSLLPPLSSFSAWAQEKVSSPTGLGLHIDPVRRYPSLDSLSAPPTPLRDSYSGPLLSPLFSSRPSSMFLGRTTRDRTNVSVPPFFAYSIPHEFPSPYTSPRLLLPGAAGPTSLPISPFARKRKHTYHYTTVQYPFPTISVKLPGQDARASYAHHLPVGDVHDVELCDYDSDHEGTKESQNQGQDQDEAKQDVQVKADVLSTAITDKRMSWASMVTMDEDLASKTPAVIAPAASQPYRPPGSRLRASSEAKSSTGPVAVNIHPKTSALNSQRPQRRASPTQEEEKTADLPESTEDAIDSKSGSSVRTRKAAPPPLNLAGNSNVETAQPGSPTTSATSSRRRRSRSRKNVKDKNTDGAQQQGKDKDTAQEAETAHHDERKKQEGTGEVLGTDSGPNSTTNQPKKTRTRSRSRSRSRSRNRAHADNNSGRGSSNESVPPVPRTPSWVPTHNMTLASAGPSSAASASLPALSSKTESTGHMAAPEDVPEPSIQAPAPISSTLIESDLKRRGPRPARLLSTRSSSNLQLQPLREGGPAVFSPRSAREAPPDYFSMRPLQHPPRTPMTPGGDFGDDDDDYYGRLQMVTTPMIQNGFFPNWAKGDAQLEELERIRMFLAARQYPDEMPLSDEWTLFFSDTSHAKDKTQVQDTYSSAITPLFSCHTVPQFATSWKYVRERVRPATMKVNQNLHWFKKGIKPMWEDPKNKYGGRLTLCPPRNLLDTVWETVLILMAGDVLDHHGEGTGAVFARRARGDRVEVWLGSDDTPEALAHIRGVLIQELTASGADELVRTAKYKKHFDSKREEKQKQQQLAKEAAAAASGATTPSLTHSPHLPMTPRMSGASSFSNSSNNLSEFQSFEAFTQHQQLAREREREREREASKEQERIMQLGKERLEREKAERDRLRDEKVRAMAAAAMAAAEVKHQQQLRERRERELHSQRT
ncbi:hypothetical protein BG011_003769 [Mortierella polycephala]|uniref:Translation initiation factor eIF4e n=1 Tax=Mortierella polycephala TaxID=41804 RepID=A0A9P6U3J7_9FUNG|nr:hypothetical protein BG011_003769 [Mortierella polycephala]